jgi:arginine-tRNA-protein transferase
MRSLYSFTTPAHECGYLPEQTARLHYEVVSAISDREYQTQLEQGWRHFGHSLFRPRCRGCQACQSLRVVVDRFRPSRSQRRAWDANRDVVATIGEPGVSDEKLALYDRFHDFHAGFKDWPAQEPKQVSGYVESFVHNPVSTEEWLYTVNDRLIGVGYVDRLPGALSAVYFYYDPAERQRSLGTYNVMRVIADAARSRIPHVYLGYFVDGCRSLEYKANFRPNQVLANDGQWVDFRVE